MTIEEIKNKVFKDSNKESIDDLSVLDFKHALHTRIITEKEYDLFWAKVNVKDYQKKLFAN